MPLSIGHFGTWSLNHPDGSLAIQQTPAGLIQSIDVLEFQNALHEEDRESFRAFCLKLVSSPSEPLFVECRLKTLSDKWAWYRFDGRAGSTANDVSAAITGIFANITTARRDADRNAEAVRRMQQFVASTSHDLQAPLRHISMFATILASELETSLSPQQRDMLKSIETKAADLKHSVQTAMRFANSTRSPTVSVVHMGELVHRTLQLLAPEIEGTGATVDMGRLPEVFADAGLLQLALTKLIENALHHSTPGTPFIMIKAEKCEGRVFVSVEDRGPGIAQEYCERVFDAYWSMPSSGNLTERRQGLGLTLAKSILLALGGNLILSKTTPSGSNFVFDLPAANGG